MARVPQAHVETAFRILLHPLAREVAVTGAQPHVVGDCTIAVPIHIGDATAAGQVAVTVDEVGLRIELARALRTAADNLTTFPAEPKEIR
ncbi:hypothetical protein [Kineococcus radiotolerans]|uniref:Uncharacterized protein n=1 Tax=Kineococcus radiotolerans (strain ATCC BAA-149 / DSM 14245 / SRS30216) TaxID=266940 RepID=A6W8U5_KINRD|nr:hypothetical protein [Kineococcus radiotolerans]ABS03234.1 hypothetical protein Krad_1748 [Kineococcus radiotolerans SRS30216 = ATCC BAA-149]